MTTPILAGMTEIAELHRAADWAGTILNFHLLVESDWVCDLAISLENVGVEGTCRVRRQPRWARPTASNALRTFLLLV